MHVITLPNEPRVLEHARQRSLTEQHLLPAVPALLMVIRGIRAEVNARLLAPCRG